MNAERIQLQHLMDQTWQEFKEFRPDIERIADNGPQPGDEQLVQAAFEILSAKMSLEDYDLEQA
jgi:hypothetical protein